MLRFGQYMESYGEIFILLRKIMIKIGVFHSTGNLLETMRSSKQEKSLIR